MNRQPIHALVPVVVGREDRAARQHGGADGDAAVQLIRGARRAEAARLALRQLTVAAHVAVLAPGHHVERGLVAHVLDLTHGGGVHARQPSRAEHVLRVVVEGDPHAAAVHEVQLLLLVVVVAAGGVPRRNLDRVHAERGHAQLAPHLAEARPVAERVDVRDGVAVTLHDLVDLVLVSHAAADYATLSALRRPPRAQSVESATSTPTTAKAGNTLVGSPARKPRPDSSTSVTGFTDAADWTQPVSRS